MTPALRVILLTVSLLAVACSDSGEPEEGTTGAEPAAPEQPRPAGDDRAGAEAAIPEDDVEPAEPEGEPLEVVVKESHLLSSIPTRDETVLHATVEEGTLEIHIEHLEAACGPVPEIDARLVAPSVVLRLVPAEDRHCIGRQEIKLRIDLPRRADVESVELRGVDGAEIVSVDVPG